MFRDIVEPSVRVGSRKAYVVPLSIVTHVIALAILIVIPILAPAVLPAPAVELIAYVARDIPLPPAPPPPPRKPADPGKPPINVNRSAAPVVAPDTIAPEVDYEPVPSVPVGVVEGVDHGLGLIGEPVVAAQPTPAPTAPMPVGGKINAPAKIKDVRPVYPAFALQARVQGIVIIETVIDPTGHVQNARVLRSVPLLDAAALDAVRQWEFTPTLLNGTPVAIVMTVTVTFQLH
jgi:protein TonB